MEEILRQPPVIDPPLMNAAGMLGFAPDLKLPLPWGQFGAFVTNPISVRPRKPASGDRWRTFPGGALLHNGHPNPGIRQVLKHNQAKWAQSPVPVIVHLLTGHPEDLVKWVERLEPLENILAVEIGVPETISAAEAAEITSAAVGERPLLVRLPLNRVQELGAICYQAGASAVSLGPARGALPGGDGLVQGRMYGPGVLPLALQAVRGLAQLDIPAIGAGGLYSQEDVDSMMLAGALAVQLDVSLWRGDWFAGEEG